MVQKHFTLATLGLFSSFCLLALLLVRLIKKEPMNDVLGIIITQISVVFYAQYVQKGKMFFLVLSSIILVLGVALFSNYVSG